MSLSEGRQIVSGVLIWIFISPLVVPILTVCAIWKCAVMLYIRLRYKDGIDIFDPMNIFDSAFTSKSDYTSLIIYAFPCEGIIELGKLRTHFNNTFIADGKDAKFPVFHYTFAKLLGYTFRKRVPLTLTHHFREENYIPPMETENAAMYRIATDQSRLRCTPQKWEIVLLHNLEKDKSTVIFKISHALADSNSIRTLMDIFTHNKGTYSNRAKPIGFLRKVKLLATSPVVMWSWYRYLVNGNVGINPYRPTKEKSLSRPPFKRQWSNTTIDFGKLKQISKQTSCRISPIFMSLQLSTYKKTLIRLGKWDENSVCNDISIQYADLAPDHPAQRSRFCTHISICVMDLPLKEDNRLKQLQIINNRLTDFENSEVATTVNVLRAIMEPILPTFLLAKVEFANDSFVSLLNPFIFSPMGYNFLGVRATNLFFLTYLADNLDIKGVILTPLTRGDEIDVSVHLCEEVFKSHEDADLYMTIFLEELDLLAKDAEKLINNGSGKQKKVKFQDIKY